jgi:predicted ATP-grasp superfamily ATP-dependent carboligase
MSEGSSLSARESLTALGRAGFHVEVVDANPLCLARFSRSCRRWHRVPSFGLDPEGYLTCVSELLEGGGFDVLFPAHEQAYLFARYVESLSRSTHIALPSFVVFDRMQSKVGFARLLQELELPAPHTAIVFDEPGLREACRSLPVYIKSAFGTATRGLFLVKSDADREYALENVRARFADGVVVQKLVEGHLERAQTVFDEGRVVAFHACRQVEEGVSGGDLVKESVRRDDVREHLRRIGTHLGWHGGLSIDYIIDAEGIPRYIDSNPRLAETGNALAAGLNLPALLVQVSLGEHPPEQPASSPRIRSFMTIQALLRSARDGRSRRSVMRATIDLVLRRGVFADGREELTPRSDGMRSLLPLGAVAMALLVHPSSWQGLSSATVSGYAATDRVVEFVRRSPATQATKPTVTQLPGV